MDNICEKNKILSLEKYNKLRSIYLEQDYKNDKLKIEKIEIIDNLTLRSTLSVTQYTPDLEDKFHLSSVTAFTYSQQMSIIAVLLDLNKETKDKELYLNKVDLKMSRQITKKTISLETKILYSKVRNGYKFYNIENNFEDGSFIFKGTGTIEI